MKKLLFFIAALLLLSSCNKRYTYVEVIREPQLFGGTRVAVKDEVKIRARSDTAAYLEAYEKFCISRAVYSGMLQRFGRPDLQEVPIGFRLYNSRDVDITDIMFTTRLEQEQKIEDHVNEISYGVFN